ncbi:MAG: glycosyltransferase family 39 protein [Candidatus Hydrogenedentes bacterium]|nr:glycosyltransferase family 39 protein [Candidatus Hydrogenedentota bacterium]
MPELVEYDNARDGNANRRWRWIFAVAVAAVVVVFSWVSLSRTLWFSPDSFLYVDVAQNLLLGRGLTHSVIITSSSHHTSGLSVPLEEWAPGFPLLIAALMRLGVPGGYAALLIASAALPLLLFSSWRIMRHAFGAGSAAVASGLLLVYLPVVYVFRHAWSDGPALALLLSGMAILFGGPTTARRAFVSGLLFGAACVFRYAMLPLLVLGPLCLLAQERDHNLYGGRRALPVIARQFAAWCAGVASLLMPVIASNLARIGHPFGDARPPSAVDWKTVVSDVFETVAAGYVPRDVLSVPVQVKMLTVLVLTVLLVAVLRRRMVPLFGETVNRGGWILAAMAFGYTSYIVAIRMLVEFDRLGPRLLLPALVPVVCLLGAFLVRGLGLRDASAFLLAMLLLSCGALWQGAALWSMPEQTLKQRISDSERLRWIVDNTGTEDLIIGDSAFDIPLYCGPRHVWCYVPVPDPAHFLGEADVKTFLGKHQGAFRHAYLVIRKAAPAEPWVRSQWQTYYGPYLTERVYSGEGIELADAFIFPL